MSKELYRVTISYRDVGREQGWERLNDGTRTLADLPPFPTRKQAVVHVAVWPGWGGGPVAKAGDLAVLKAVGDRACWDEWQPTVDDIVDLGMVHIDVED